MKRVSTLAVMYFLAASFCVAQTPPGAVVGKDSMAWRYIHLTFDVYAFLDKGKVKIVSDHQKPANAFWAVQDKDLLLDDKGTLLQFNNFIDCLNYLSIRGWELAFTYMDTGNSGVTHFLMKRWERYSTGSAK